MMRIRCCSWMIPFLAPTLHWCGSSVHDCMRQHRNTFCAWLLRAGKPEHFSEVFHKTKASAGLAAGIFHRREVPIEAVKEHMVQQAIPTRV